MTVIAENIKKLMELEGINPADLSAITGIERSTLHRILDGSTKNPTIESIKSIIKHYSFDEVVFGLPAINNKKDEISIISWSEAATYPFDLNLSKHKTIKTSVKASKTTFALTIEHRLDGRFPQGALLIVDPERQPKNRSYLIVKEKGDSLPLIKRYIVDGSTAYLKPIDLSLPSIKYNPEQYKIIGVIIQSIFDFEE